MMTNETADKIRNMKVLFAEDDGATGEILSMVFKRFFKDVIHVKNGREAKMYLENNKDIDIIVTDIKMPEINGIDLINEIQKSQINIPIIVVSAYEREFKEELKKLNIPLLVKPLDLGNFYETVDKLLNHKKKV